MKYQMHINIKKSYPEDSKLTPTEWFLLYLLKRKRSYAPFFPLFLSIAEAVLCIPVSNAWPERGASSIKNIKTRLRSRLTNTMLEGILHIQINGPPVNKSNELVREAVDVCLMESESNNNKKLTLICFGVFLYTINHHSRLLFLDIKMEMQSLSIAAHLAKYKYYEYLIVNLVCFPTSVLEWEFLSDCAIS